jgi:hypothetical protein
MIEKISEFLFKGLVFHLYDTRDPPPTTGESPEPRLIFEFPEFSAPVDTRLCSFLSTDRERYQLSERRTGGLFYPSNHDGIVYMGMRLSGIPSLLSEKVQQDYLLMALKSTFLNRAALLGPLEPNTHSIRIDSKDWFSSVFISSHSHPKATLHGTRWIFPPNPQENTITIREYHAGRVNRARHLPTSDPADLNMKISHSHLTYDFDERWLKNTSELPKLAQWPYFQLTRSLPEDINAYDYWLSDNAVISINVSTLVKSIA